MGEGEKHGLVLPLQLQRGGSLILQLFTQQIESPEELTEVFGAASPERRSEMPLGKLGGVFADFGKGSENRKIHIRQQSKDKRAHRAGKDIEKSRFSRAAGLKGIIEAVKPAADFLYQIIAVAPVSVRVGDKLHMGDGGVVVKVVGFAVFNPKGDALRLHPVRAVSSAVPVCVTQQQVGAGQQQRQRGDDESRQFPIAFDHNALPFVAITHAPHGQNVGRLFRVGFDFLPQPFDMHREGLLLGEAVKAPYAVEQKILAQRPAGVLRQ